MKKRVFGVGIFLSLAVCAQAGDKIVHWGSGANMDVLNPDAKVSGTWCPSTWAEATGNTYNPAFGPGQPYYADYTDRTPAFTMVGLPYDESGSMDINGTINRVWNGQYIQISSRNQTQAMVVWEAGNFLSGVPKRLESLEATSALWGDESVTGDIRFVIQENGDPVTAAWYISEVVLSWSARDQYFTTASHDVADLKWYDYSPNTPFSGLSNASATTPGRTRKYPNFRNTKFRAVGFWGGCNAGVNWRHFRVVEFKAIAADPLPNVKLYIISN